MTKSISYHSYHGIFFANLLHFCEKECAAYGPQLRRRCAELRAAAAKRRLELLRTGQMKAGMAQEIDEIGPNEIMIN